MPSALRRASSLKAMACIRDLCTHPSPACRTAHRREPTAPCRRATMASSASTCGPLVRQEVARGLLRLFT
eukprot:10819089-Heterocapsa_arctica.AAC.1